MDTIRSIMVIGQNVAETCDRLYYFEQACETYIRALWVLSDEIAERTAIRRML